MPAATTPQKRAAAARSEVNGRKKTVEFRGVKLKVPSKVPGEVLFDIGDDNVTGTLRTILGETQLREVREKVAADGLSLQQTVTALTEFVNDLFDTTYGITTGE